MSRNSDADARAHRAAESIYGTARRMNRLIQDLLAVSRMEAGRLSLDRKYVPAARVVAEVVETQHPLATSASVELASDVAPEPVEVWADPHRLHRVFENLIGNALKFTRPGGRVTVGAAARDGEVEFRIADTGDGIAPDHLPHVFDRFWQAHGTTRLGAGLGLPIVKGIVEAHGGRIWVESGLGRGTTVFFTMPTAAHATRSAPELFAGRQVAAAGITPV